jgi:hypothetical protein
VLLVGGSSRIPLVAELVAADLARPVAVDAHPKDAVALGAALALAGAHPVPPDTSAEPPPAPAPEPTPTPEPEPEPEPVPVPVPVPAHEPEVVVDDEAQEDVEVPIPAPAGGASRPVWKRLVLPLGAVIVLVAAVAGVVLLADRGDDGGGEATDVVEGETIVGFDESGGAVERGVFVPAMSMLVVRGTSTADLVISVLTDDENVMEESRALLGEFSDAIVSDFIDPTPTTDITDRDGAAGEIVADLPATAIASEDETSSEEEEVLGLPFLVDADVTIIFTNFDGFEGTIDARIDVIPIDSSDDPEEFVDAVSDDATVQELWPELSI